MKLHDHPIALDRDIEKTLAVNVRAEFTPRFLGVHGRCQGHCGNECDQRQFHGLRSPIPNLAYARPVRTADVTL